MSDEWYLDLPEDHTKWPEQFKAFARLVYTMLMDIEAKERTAPG